MQAVRNNECQDGFHLDCDVSFEAVFICAGIGYSLVMDGSN